MGERDFSEILRQAASGDRPAVAELYGRYNRMLVRYLRAQVPGYGEDLAHETWLAITPRLPRFRGDERQFRMLLLTEGRRLVAGVREAAKRDQALPFPPRQLSGLRPSPVGDEPVADAAIAELLAGLRPLHAEILLLRVVAGLSAEETGAILGKSPGVIRVTQHRVLRQLARRLGDRALTPGTSAGGAR